MSQISKNKNYSYIFFIFMDKIYNLVITLTYTLPLLHALKFNHPTASPNGVLHEKHNIIFKLVNLLINQCQLTNQVSSLSCFLKSFTNSNKKYNDFIHHIQNNLVIIFNLNIRLLFSFIKANIILNHTYIHTFVLYETRTHDF